MKREGEMPNDKQTKKGNTDERGNQRRTAGRSSTQSSEGSTREPSRSPRDATLNTPNMNRSMFPAPLHSDPAAEKLASIAPPSLPPFSFPFQSPQYRSPSSSHSVSREDFRRLLIRTIDEALRILEDDSDTESVSENYGRDQ